MSVYRFLGLAACAALAACAQQPPQPGPADEAPAKAQTRPPRVVTAKPEPRDLQLPGVEL